MIFTNNMYVLIFTLVFSLIFGAGVIFILAWNASVIGAAIGIFTNSSLKALPLGLVRYIPLFRGKGKKREIKKIFRFSAKITSFSSILGAVLLFLFSELIAVNIFHEPRLILFLKALKVSSSSQME